MKIEEVEKHYRKNYRTLVKKTRNRVPNGSTALAEEVVQEAYSRVYKYFETYSPKDKNFDGWFHRILMNCVSDCKSQEADRGVVRSNTEEEGVQFTEKLDQDTILHIQNSINSYAPEDKKIIQLYFFCGLNTREISECVGRGHSAVRLFLHRFGKSMREEL